MKLQKTITILLLCSALVVTAITEGECCTDCIAKLANNGKPRKGEGNLPTVSTFTTPSTDFQVLADGKKDTDYSKVCGAYWTANGAKTCCNQKELGKRIKVKKQRITKRFQHLLWRIKKAHAQKKQVALVLETLKDTNVQKNIKDKSSADNQVENITQDMIDEAIKILEEIAAKKPENSDGKEDKKKAASKFKDCVKAYGDSQIDLLCFDCSTKVLDFYDTKTLKVSKEWCTKITKECAGLFGISARNMAFENILRLINNYIDDKGTKMKGLKSKKIIKTKADFDMLTSCSADPVACAADDTKRQSFCSFLSIGNDNPALFGDGAGGKMDITKMKERRPKGKKPMDGDKEPIAGTRLLMRLGMRVPKVINRILAIVGDDYTFVTEDASGLKLEKITSGAEFLAEELPEANPEDGTPAKMSGSMMNSFVIVALMVGTMFVM